MIVTLTECLIYLCFSYLMGTLIFYSLPRSKWPDVMISRRLLLLSTIGTGALSFAPILSVILNLSKNIGLWVSIKGVLLTFEIGQAWLLTLAISVLLFLLIYFNPLGQDPMLAKIALFLSVVLIGTYVKSGQATSLSPIFGFSTHFLHLLAVSVWGGCLLIAAWGTRSARNWLSFLTWFAPFAILSIIVIIGAGFATMVIDISPSLHRTIPAALGNYRDGLVVNYGQALLIKHLLIIPLLLLAFFNGYYTRSQLKKNKTMHSIKWVRLESMVLIGIFIVTAYMGQQAPPLDLNQLLHFHGESPLFQAIYGQNIPQNFSVHLNFGMISLVFLSVSLLLLILISFAIIRKLSILVVSGMILAYLTSSYLAIILAIQ